MIYYLLKKHTFSDYCLENLLNAQTTRKNVSHLIKEVGKATITFRVVLQDEREFSFKEIMNFKTGGSAAQSAIPKHSGLSY